jgi:hypothetical protein
MNEPDRADLPEWPRLMSEELATRYLSIGRTMLAEKGPAPQLIGRRKLWDRRDLDRWADRLSGQQLDQEQLEKEQDEVERRFKERMAGTEL